MSAAVLATVLVGALRNARRAGLDLAAQARTASAALLEHTQDSEFVTGQLVRIDLNTGTAHVVNAGHPCPLHLRSGRMETVNLDADPPFGVVRDHGYRVQELPLGADDRLWFLTDSLLERNAADLDIRALVETSAGQHPREAVQHLMAAVLEASTGNLQDDATALCLDWHGGSDQERNSSAGANR